jgi:HNH endonuclease
MKRTNIPDHIKIKVRETARFRCGYCLILQQYSPMVFQFDHYIPISLGGTNDEENLWLVCGNCDNAKSDKIHAFDSVTDSTVAIFNPRTQIWNEHFEMSKDGTKIIGKTAIGRGTVIALNLNDKRIVAVRREWVSAGWHPPKD